MDIDDYSHMNMKSICGVIIASNNPEQLAGFYSSVFDISFERELHGDLVEHFGIDIGDRYPSAGEFG